MIHPIPSHPTSDNLCPHIQLFIRSGQVSQCQDSDEDDGNAVDADVDLCKVMLMVMTILRMDFLTFLLGNTKSNTIPHICHEHHERRSCKFFLAGVNFYRFNAKNWHFRQILPEKVAFFLQI